jgi:hypothetical protein
MRFGRPDALAGKLSPTSSAPAVHRDDGGHARRRAVAG